MRVVSIKLKSLNRKSNYSFILQHSMSLDLFIPENLGKLRYYRN